MNAWEGLVGPKRPRRKRSTVLQNALAGWADHYRRSGWPAAPAVGEDLRDGSGGRGQRPRLLDSAPALGGGVATNFPTKNQLVTLEKAPEQRNRSKKGRP